MFDKVILENGVIFDCHKNKKMCYKAIYNCSHALEFVPNCHKTQKMRNNAVNTYPSAIQFIPDQKRHKKCVIKLLIQLI